jgi:hypothetical protein
LESRVDAVKALDLPPQELINELSVLLAKMTKSLADATGSIPSYDQKQFEIVGMQYLIKEQAFFLKLTISSAVEKFRTSSGIIESI